MKSHSKTLNLPDGLNPDLKDQNVFQLLYLTVYENCYKTWWICCSVFEVIVGMLKNASVLLNQFEHKNLFKIFLMSWQQGRSECIAPWMLSGIKNSHKESSSMCKQMNKLGAI